LLVIMSTGYYEHILPDQFIITEFECTVKPDYPRDPKKAAFVPRRSLCRSFSIKTGIKTSLAGLSLAVVDRWPLFRGGR
jgi:hypothetical protein